MKITFLGTAGGRFAVMTQKRQSGGFVVEMDGEMIFFDPGPGSLVYAVKNRINLRKLTGIVVTHTHPDHSADMEIITEAMTFGAKKRRGVVIGNEYLTKGSGNGNYLPVLSKYHLEAVDKAHSLSPGQSANIGKLKVTAVRTKHRDSKAIGIIIDGSCKLGYTSDTEYFDGIEELVEFENKLQFVKDKMNNLHEYDKLLFEIYFSSGKSIRKLAKDTGISTTSIYTTLKNVKQYLKDEVESEYKEFER